VKPRSTGLRLFTEGGIYTLGLFILRAGNFLLLPLYLSLLEPEAYGAFGVVKQVVNVLVILAISAQGHAMLRMGVDTEGDQGGMARLVSSVFSYVALASLALAGITALCWPFLGEQLDGIPLWPIGAAGLLGVSGAAVFQLLLTWLQFQRKPKEHTTLNLLRWLTMMVLVVFFVAGLGWKAEGILAAIAISFVVGAIYGLRHLPPGTRPRIHRATLMGTLGYGLPLLPHALSGVIFQATDQVLLAAHPEHGLANAGIYLLATQIASGVFMFAMGMQKAWTPFFLREDRDRSDGGWNRVRVLSFFSVSMVGCMAVGFGLLAPELIGLVGIFGDGKYLAAAGIVPILTFSAFVRSYYLVGTAVVLANKSVARWLALGTLPAAMLNIVLNSLWIPRWGMEGAAWATMTSYFVSMLCMGTLARRARKVPFKYGRALVLMTLVGATLWVGQDQALTTRLLLIGGFGLALLSLDAKDMRKALSSLRRKAD